MGQSGGTNPKGPRCIALIGPFQSGKTTLLEAILARTGAIQRQGTVEAGTTVGDGSAEARHHRMSVEVSVASTTFDCTDAATSASFASESTVMNTSRWIDRSPSMCTRTPRCAAWRRTQSPKWRAAASSISSTPSTSHAARAAMLAITSLATRTAPSDPFSLTTR